MRRAHATGTGQETGSGSSRADRLGFLVGLGICLTVPAIGAIGLSVPLPSVVERLAAFVVSGSSNLSYEVDSREGADGGAVLVVAGASRDRDGTLTSESREPGTGARAVDAPPKDGGAVAPGESAAQAVTEPVIESEHGGADVSGGTSVSGGGTGGGGGQAGPGHGSGGGSQAGSAPDDPGASGAGKGNGGGASEAAGSGQGNGNGNGGGNGAAQGGGQGNAGAGHEAGQGQGNGKGNGSGEQTGSAQGSGGEGQGQGQGQGQGNGNGNGGGQADAAGTGKKDSRPDAAEGSATP
jgi:hypothetical protein